MANEDVKNLIKKKRLFQYEVAEQMGVSEGYLSTMLRRELPKDDKNKIIEAINKLTNQED